MITYKLSDEVAAKYGIKSVADLEAILDKSISQPEQPVAPAVAVNTPAADASVAPAAVVAPAAEPVVTAPAAPVPATVAAPVAPAAEPKTENIQALIATAVADAFASLGSPVPLKIVGQKNATKREELMEQMMAITDAKERGRFYDAHRNEILEVQE